MHEQQFDSVNPVSMRHLDLNMGPVRSGCDSSDAFLIQCPTSELGTQCVEVSSNDMAISAWKTRNRVSSGPNRRDKVQGRSSALEQALLKFAENQSGWIMSPDVGTEFDDVEEAFEYYNLYSWERGFGIRLGRKRLSDSRESRKLPLEKRYQLGQEFYCCCAGRPSKDLRTSSSRTNCPAKLRFGRTSDHGWIVMEHTAEHNHPLSESFGENRLWPSHTHLDKHTKDLIRKLRENNVLITKLYSILGSFFGKIQNVPATKRSLKYLCQKINKEMDGDIKKTLQFFSQHIKMMRVSCTLLIQMRMAESRE